MALDAVTKSAPMPAPPERQYSFTDWQVAHPTEPPPGDRLDAEFDRANGAVSDVIDWASVSLNTDGTLRDGSVDEGTLQPGLFDSISEDIISDVQPLVDQAQAYANSALDSKTGAESAAADAETQNAAAQMAAGTAVSSATNALNASRAAQDYANAAGASAGDADDSANHAAGDAALAEDWGLVSQAWAEHMPDPIPPNILAVMGITGDHWSSRWWAHKAAGAFGAMSELYLGALPTPPTSTSTGEPIPTGAIYYNTANQTTYVWDGAEWQPLTQPGKGVVSSLVYRATAGQTVFDTHTPDITGTNFIMKPNTPVEVYVNGVRVIPNVPAGQGDYVLDTVASTITFVQPLQAGTMVQVDLMVEPSDLAPAGVTTIAVLDFNIDPATGTPGQIDGTRRSFPLARASDRTSITVSRASDLCVVLDGVIQQPDSDYTATASTITFTEAPLVGADAWGLWYAPGPPGAGGSYLPLTGGTLTGPLVLNADPTLPLGAATMQYVDTKVAGGAFLPLTGGTVTGATTFSGTLVVGGTASLGTGQTNYFQVVGSAANPTLQVAGSSTNAAMLLRGKGTGGVNIGSLTSGNILTFVPAASNTESLSLTQPSALGQAFQIQATGGVATGGVWFRNLPLTLGGAVTYVGDATNPYNMPFKLGETISGTSANAQAGGYAVNQVLHTYTNFTSGFSPIAWSVWSRVDAGSVVRSNMAASFASSITAQPKKADAIAWIASTSYPTVGTLITSNGYLMQLTTAGVSGSTAPGVLGGSSSGSITDGSCVWLVIDARHNTHYAVAVDIKATANYNLGGTATDPVGSNFAACFGAGNMDGSATFYTQNVVLELDDWMRGTANRTATLQLVKMGGSGLRQDWGISFGGDTSYHWRNPIIFDSFTTDPTNGYAIAFMDQNIAADAHMAGVLDMLLARPDGAGQYGGGFFARWGGANGTGQGMIDQASRLILDYGVISPTSTGLSIDTNRLKFTSATIVSGGANWVAGGTAIDPQGNVVTVTVNASNQVTGIASIRYAATVSVAPSNPVTFSPINPTNLYSPLGSLLWPTPFTANVTYSAASTPTLALQPSGNATSFGGSVTLAADPSADLQAATKQYVDARAIGSGVVVLGATDNVTLQSGGAGHAVGDVITLSGGAKIGVNDVASGVINSWVLIDRGSVVPPAAVPANPVAQISTTGAGTGASFNLAWGVIAAGLAEATLTTNGGNLLIGGEQPAPGFTGSESTFIGVRAGSGWTTGGFNTAIGHNAGGQGVAIGAGTNGQNNVYVGMDAGRNIGPGSSNNVAVGANAGRNIFGAFSTFFGALAGRGSETSRLTGNSNTGIGYAAVGGTAAMTTGYGNVGMGDSAGADLTTGYQNVLIGYHAGQNIITGFQNVAVGTIALDQQTGGAGNVAVGFGAGSVLVSANNNLLLGANAGSKLTSGGGHTILGANVASTTLATGASNIYIGNSSAVDGASAGESNTFRLGGTGGTTFSATGLNTLTPAWSLLGTLSVNGATTFSAAGMALTVNANAQIQGTTTLGNASTNYLQVLGAAASPIIQVAGGGTNGSLLLQSQGQGNVNLRSPQGIILQCSDGGAGSAINAVSVTARATGTAAMITALDTTGGLCIMGASNKLGFHNTTPIAKPTISGACAGNTAIKALLTALASYGLVTDSTTA